MSKQKYVTEVEPVDRSLPALRTTAVNQIFVIRESERKDFVIGAKDCLYLTHNDGTVVNIFIEDGQLYAAAGNPYPNAIEIVLQNSVTDFEIGKVRIEIISESDGQFNVRVSDLSQREIIIASIGSIVRHVNRSLGQVLASEVDLDSGGSCDVAWGGAEEIMVYLRKEQYVICRIREDEGEIYLENPDSGQRYVLKVGENLLGRRHQGAAFFGQSGDRVSRDHLAITLVIDGAGNKVLSFKDLDSTNGSKLKIRRRPYIWRHIIGQDNSAIDLTAGYDFEAVSICAALEGSILSSDARMLAATHPGNPGTANCSGILCDPKIRTIALAERSRRAANDVLAVRFALQSMYIDAVSKNDLAGMGRRACDYLMGRLPQVYTNMAHPGAMVAFAREVKRADGRYVEGFTVGDCHAYILGIDDGLIYHPSRWENQELTPFGMQGDLNTFETTVKSGERILILLLSYLVSSVVSPAELKRIFDRTIRDGSIENLAYVVARVAGLEYGRKAVAGRKLLAGRDADFAVAQMICGGE